MKHLNKLTLLLLPLLLACCGEKLPEPTQNGSDTIACKVNGKAWIADRGAGFNTKKFSLLYSNDFVDREKINFVLYSSRIAEDSNTHIQLALEDVRKPGIYRFSSDTNPYPAALVFKNHGMYIEYKPNNANYMTNSRHTGQVTFTRVDTVNHIMVGTFEFTAESTDGSGQTVRVTDGRFDIKYGQ